MTFLLLPILKRSLLFLMGLELNIITASDPLSAGGKKCLEMPNKCLRMITIHLGTA